MATTTTPMPAVVSTLDKIFPRLKPEYVERIAVHGKRRSVVKDEILLQQGDKYVSFLVVLKGELEVVRPSALVDTLIATLGPGQFTGEINLLAGRRAMVRARMTGPGEVIELTREQLLALVQADAEISDIIMRAFILRRMNLVAQGMGDVVLLGSAYSAGTLRIKEFLTRNGHPYSYIDLENDADAQLILDRFHVKAEEIPVLICRGQTVLRNPTNRQIAECLGFNEALDPSHLQDLLVVGGGPAGLAAAVYGASEGLEVLVLENDAPGGQAGMSSKIENYLGFPTGVSGQELAGRALVQAQKFGAQIAIAKRATHLHCKQKPFQVELEDGTLISARSIIIATGAEYRKLPLENLSKYEGSGVYYAATFVEAQYCAADEVVVVGGGNSAGQAAVFLSQTVRKVHILIRSKGLAQTMSRYLIRRIEENPKIDLHTFTEVTALEGNSHLERITWKNNQTGKTETHPIRHLFLMMGAVPNTAWLKSCIALDEKGFIQTGPDLPKETNGGHAWKLARPPFLLETSLPGVFAVGDVRCGNVKRVASAVGEGSIAVFFVHQFLKE